MIDIETQKVQVLRANQQNAKIPSVGVRGPEVEFYNLYYCR